METILQAIAAMVLATLMSHMGLSKAMADIVRKIAKCHMCTSFWVTLSVLYFRGTPVLLSALLAIVMAYSSNWFVMLLVWMQKRFDKLWERMSKQ